MGMLHCDDSIAEKLSALRLKYEESRSSVVRLVRDFAEILEAYRLVYEEYLKRGYCQPNDSRMHYSPYCFLPHTQTFVWKEEDRLHGTLSLICDSDSGLPAESAFADEIQALREEGKALAEISLFAIDSTEERANNIFAAGAFKLARAFPLFREMFRHARELFITDFVIAIHPRQEPIYQSLTFQRISPNRPYPAACGNPAVAMHVNIQRWMKETPDERTVKTYLLAPIAEAVPPRILSRSTPLSRQRGPARLSNGIVPACSSQSCLDS